MAGPGGRIRKGQVKMKKWILIPILLMMFAVPYPALAGTDFPADGSTRKIKISEWISRFERFDFSRSYVATAKMSFNIRF